MKGGFIKWLQRKLKKPPVRPPVKTEITLLPQTRLYALTPTASQETLTQTASSTLPESGFFSKLPYDVRRLILVTAFGDRPVHMDLSFSLPISRLAPGESNIGTHCDINTVNNNAYNAPLNLDYDSPPSWHWWGSVCHRVPPNLPRDAMGCYRGPRGPWEDRCRSGYGQCCDEWPGQKPDKCFIGAMGWLLTCRKAYEEGISVLYSTNTILMYSDVMISHLPELIRPQRLASITSLEIAWLLKAHLPYDPHEPASLDLVYLGKLSKLLTSSFPSLRRLYLALLSPYYMSRAIDAQTMIPKQMDSMVRQIPHLRQCSIAIPGSVFVSLLEDVVRAITTERQAQKRVLCFPGQLWRTLDGGWAVVESRISPYPDPPRLTDSDTTNDKPGYWILSGNDDVPLFHPQFL